MNDLFDPMPDFPSATYREDLAAWFNRRHDALCEILGGDKGTAFGMTVLTDKLQRRPPMMAYFRKVDDGMHVLYHGAAKAIKTPYLRHEDLFPPSRVEERRTDRWHEVKGVRYYEYRHELSAGVLQRYNPLPQEERDRRNAKREANAAAKKLQKEREAFPLFAEMIS